VCGRTKVTPATPHFGGATPPLSSNALIYGPFASACSVRRVCAKGTGTAMPTLEHNAIIEMFRENPALAPRFLATLFHVEIPPYASIEVVEASLDQLIPVEFRADLVQELRDENGDLLLSIVVEVQRDKHPDKKFSWPVYVTVKRAKDRCATVLLVIAPDGDVAVWADETIDLGLRLGSIKPLVIGPAAVPEIVDPALAERQVELAVLSAVVHGNGPNGFGVVKAALLALNGVDREHAMVYFQIIDNVLREPVRRALEVLFMENQSERPRIYSPTARKLFDMGQREGQREGQRDGLRDALLRLIARAGITLTDEERTRIQTCSETETLDRWIDNMLGAKNTDDIFGQG